MRWAGSCVSGAGPGIWGTKKMEEREKDGGWDLEEEKQDVSLGLLLACMKGERGKRLFSVYQPGSLWAT